MVWFICRVWGAYDPTFSWSAENNMGKLAAEMIVLIGFSMYGALVVGWQHYPLVDLGLKQPFIDLIEFFLGMCCHCR